MNTYEIITKQTLRELDLIGDEAHDDPIREAFYREQDDVLKAHGYSMNDDVYSIHVFDSAFHFDARWNMTIYEAIDYLAVKDGYDVVRFDNGNIGVVAYYSGQENGFEILGDFDPCNNGYDDDDDDVITESAPGLPWDFFWV